MSISILLGAGFSAPQGFPIGNTLNQKILNCKNEHISFAPCGTLSISKDGRKPDFGYKTQYDWYFDFCMDLILYYNDKIRPFDYEEFYDYFNDKKLCNNRLVIELFKRGNYNPQLEQSLENYLFQIKSIYNQIISYFLVDKNGECRYDNAPHIIGNVDGYSGFLNCLMEFKKDNIVNIHTLNHDLFFERLNKTDYINGDLSDGFKELSSPYYGKIITDANNPYMVRLEYYNGNYDSNIRLYKLHGSKDYLLYSITEQNNSMTPDCYVKNKYGIGCGELYKEVLDSNGKYIYNQCYINYHPDFLTGTTSKILRYEEPLLFKKLFALFEENLKNADKLIIIGYGCKDSEINKMIKDNFYNANKKCYIVDPYAGEQVELFIKNYGDNISLIKKQLNDLNLEDFQ